MQCGACKKSKSKRKCDGSHAGCEKYKGIQPEAATDTISDAQQRAEVDYTSEKVGPFFVDKGKLQCESNADHRQKAKRKAKDDHTDENSSTPAQKQSKQSKQSPAVFPTNKADRGAWLASVFQVAAR